MMDKGEMMNDSDNQGNDNDVDKATRNQNQSTVPSSGSKVIEPGFRYKRYATRGRKGLGPVIEGTARTVRTTQGEGSSIENANEADQPSTQMTGTRKRKLIMGTSEDESMGGLRRKLEKLFTFPIMQIVTINEWIGPTETTDERRGAAQPRENRSSPGLAESIDDGDERVFLYESYIMEDVSGIAEKVYNWVMSCCSHELNRDWVVHDRIWEIRLKGAKLKDQFMLGNHIEKDVCSMVFRLIEREDCYLFRGLPCGRVCHYIPPEWAVHVLIQCGYLESEKVKELFIGPGLGFDPTKSELFVLPVFVLGWWACYAWEKKRRCLHFLDPVMTTSSQDQQSNRADSAVYIFHYARHFDGEKLQYSLPEEFMTKARAYWLYKLLSMKGNFGTLP